MGRPTFATPDVLLLARHLQDGRDRRARHRAGVRRAARRSRTARTSTCSRRRTGTCPTFDATAPARSPPADCPGAGPKAGVLTNPGVDDALLRQLRVPPRALGPGDVRLHQVPGRDRRRRRRTSAAPSPYTGVWPFTSIAGLDDGGRVDFQDVSAVICANCHQTHEPHRAAVRELRRRTASTRPAIAVPTPLDGAPLARLTDYLPAGETTAWRYRRPGRRPARPSARRWPRTPTSPSAASLASGTGPSARPTSSTRSRRSRSRPSRPSSMPSPPSGYKMKDLIYAVYTSDDFVKF